MYASITIYLLIGVFRVWLDFRQPIINQPRNVAERKWLFLLFTVLTWPFLIWNDINWWYRRTSAKLRKVIDKVKILVVDDEPNIVQTLQDRFEMNDYEVLTAGSEFRKLFDKTFLIIYKEPGMDQILQERFRMQWPELKTITISPEQFGKDNSNLVKGFEKADLVIITSNHIPYPYASEDIIELLYKINPKMPVIFTPCYPRSGMSINERFPTMNIKWIRSPYDLAKIFEAIYEIEGLFEEPSIKN